MKTFHLEILTPERVFFKGECVCLSVPITDGMIGILAGREPVTASVTVGDAHYVSADGTRVIFSVSDGMLDVSAEGVTLICDSALLPEEIDAEAARIEAELARAKLSGKQSRRDYLMSKLMLTNAINNLKVKEKSSIN